jgi:meso-butanediol dehydrogenase / (S,S)-butanediol dehydrogenase / diacetyl reductase
MRNLISLDGLCSSPAAGAASDARSQQPSQTPGATVVVTGRSQPKLDEALRAMPEGVSAIRGDVSQRADVEALVSALIAEHGKLDIVISNAASYVPGDITDVDPRDWETLRSVNIDGFFHLAQLSLPYLAQTRGSFIATSSVSGIGGDWSSAIYGASKGAVSLFVKSLAVEWGARGVRINAVAPSATTTGSTSGVFGNGEVRAA